MLNPLSILREIRALFKIRRFMVRTLSLYHVMLPGKYKIHWSEKPILYNENDASVTKRHPVVFLHFLSYFFSKKIVMLHKDIEFNGEYAVMSLNNEMKIFSIANRQVLSIMKNEKKERLQSVAKKLSGLNLAYSHSVDCGVVDRLINDELKKLSFSKKRNLYFRFLEDYQNFAKRSPVEDSMLVKSRLSSLKAVGKDVSNVVVRLSKYMSSESYPVIFSHCDLHLDNMMCENGKIWYIDIEYARNEIFIYDIFIAIVVGFWKYGDSYLLKEYLCQNGNLVDRIASIFNVMGKNFHVSQKKEYLFDFLAARLLFDVANGKKRFGKIGFARYMKYLAKQNNSIIDYIEALYD